MARDSDGPDGLWPPSDSDPVLPIGQLVGRTPDSPPQRVSEVRVGTSVLTMFEPRFAVWELAHGWSEPPARPAPITFRELHEAATDRHPDMADAIRGELLGLGAVGLLITAPPGSAKADTFARTHRLLPTALDLGPDPDAPGHHALGLPGRPLLSVPARATEIWARSDQASNLDQACRELADNPHTVGSICATDLRDELLEALPGLLRHRLVVLDQAARTA